MTEKLMDQARREGAAPRLHPARHQRPLRRARPRVRPCRALPGYLTPGQYPPGLSHRQQVVRAYDHEGRIAVGVLVADGQHALPVILELLARPDVKLVHLRNVGYGCYNFAFCRA